MLMSSLFEMLQASLLATCSTLFSLGGQPQESENNDQPEKTAQANYWVCGCVGSCADGTGTGATGGGNSIGAAIAQCESKMAGTCWNKGGLISYSGTGCSEI